MVSADDLKNLDPPASGKVFVTLDKDGNPAYRIDFEGTTVKIYGPPGADGKSELLTKIWGDPPVDAAGHGSGNSDWHFGNDSTFILPDVSFARGPLDVGFTSRTFSGPKVAGSAFTKMLRSLERVGR